MKIEQRKGDRRANAEVQADLVKASSSAITERRVCNPECDAVCPSCSSMSCACSCSSDCAYIPAQLTSDPNFPIETMIAPLAFELKRLGVFEPCWSCEGHTDRNDRLWKIPRVWFYCDSVVYVRLLSDVLKELEIEELINGPWQVQLTFSDKDNPATTFSPEPEIGSGSGPGFQLSLKVLQEDVKVITKYLAPMFTRRAELLAASTGRRSIQAASVS